VLRGGRAGGGGRGGILSVLRARVRGGGLVVGWEGVGMRVFDACFAFEGAWGGRCEVGLVARLV